MGLVLRVRGCFSPCVPAGNVGNVDSSLWWAALLVGNPKVSRLPNRLQQGKDSNLWQGRGYAQALQAQEWPNIVGWGTIERRPEKMCQCRGFGGNSRVAGPI